MQNLWNGVLAQYLVIERKRAKTIGLVAAYQADFNNGHAYIAAAKFQPDQQSPTMMLGLGLFLRYLFWCWDFRKLYLEIPEYNLGQFRSAVGRYIEIEGTLRSHIALGGQRWDQHIASITKEQWTMTAAPLLNAIAREEQ
jgi:hypothetical protein